MLTPLDKLSPADVPNLELSDLLQGEGLLLLLQELQPVVEELCPVEMLGTVGEL